MIISQLRQVFRWVWANKGMLLLSASVLVLVPVPSRFHVGCISKFCKTDPDTGRLVPLDESLTRDRRRWSQDVWRYKVAEELKALAAKDQGYQYTELPESFVKDALADHPIKFCPPLFSYLEGMVVECNEGATSSGSMYEAQYQPIFSDWLLTQLMIWLLILLIRLRRSKKATTK
jgi:hypothetical protein